MNVRGTRKQRQEALGKLFIEKAQKLHGSKYDYSLVDYTYASQKVKITCPVHGVWLQRPNDHLMGCGCPGCKFDKIATMKRGSEATFVKKARKTHGKAYDYSKVVYVNAITKVEIICPEHGSFFQTPDKHTSGGTACPRCSHFTSKGERTIEKFLDALGVAYEREKRFDGLVGTTPNSRLRFDFWLPQHNLLIEYDGAHHFEPIQTKGRLSKQQAVVKHEATKTNDEKKDNFARKNGYRLLRIRYDEDVEQKLFANLSEIPKS